MPSASLIETVSPYPWETKTSAPSKLRYRQMVLTAILPTFTSIDQVINTAKKLQVGIDTIVRDRRDTGVYDVVFFFSSCAYISFFLIPNSK